MIRTRAGVHWQPPATGMTSLFQSVLTTPSLPWFEKIVFKISRRLKMLSALVSMSRLLFYFFGGGITSYISNQSYDGNEPAFRVAFGFATRTRVLRRN